MTWDEVVAYCLAKPGAWRDEPWEGDGVAKVGSKIFAFFGSTGPSIGLKCGPDRDVADEWLTRYPDDASVMAYIGRSGWNTLTSAAPSRRTRSSPRSTPRTTWWSRSCPRRTARPRSNAETAAGALPP